MNWRFAVLTAKLLLIAVCFHSAHGQGALKDEALTFSSSVEEYAFSVTEDDWLEHEASFDLLPVTIRLQRYQDLAFKYLVEMKSDEYDRLRAKYLQDLEKFGNDDHKVTQDILDAFSLRAKSGDYDAAIDQLNELLRTENLSESQRERATAALAYALTDAGKPEAAAEALEDIRSDEGSKSASPRAEIEREDASAYVHLHAGDYPAALYALRMSARRQLEAEMPFDSAYMLSSTAWLLRESGEAQAAREVSQSFGAAKERAEQRSQQGSGGGGSRSMADATPSSGAAGAPPPLRQRSDPNETEADDAQDSEPVTTHEDIPWGVFAWSASGIAGLIGLVVVYRRVVPDKKVTTRNYKFPREPEIEPEAVEDEPPAPEPVPDPVEEARIPEVPIKLRSVEDVTEGLLNDLRVLIVDDNDINIEVLVGFLEAYGLKNYYTAKNGEEAWSIALRAPTDLIFMDVQMPVMNGIEATKRIREHKKGKSIPIVGVTAFSRVVNEEMCFAAGMNDFLTKPVEMDKLYTSLKKALHSSEADRASS